MGLVRFRVNQDTLVEDEDRTLGEVLNAQGLGENKVAYDPTNPTTRYPMHTRVGELEGRTIGLVEPATLGEGR